MNLYKEMAGKSTRKGPERELWFLNFPQLSHRYGSLSFQEHEIPRSREDRDLRLNSFSKSQKFSNTTRNRWVLNFKQSKIQDISYNYPTIQALNPKRSWRNVSQKRWSTKWLSQQHGGTHTQWVFIQLLPKVSLRFEVGWLKLEAIHLLMKSTSMSHVIKHMALMENTLMTKNHGGLKEVAKKNNICCFFGW